VNKHFFVVGENTIKFKVIDEHGADVLDGGLSIRVVVQDFANQHYIATACYFNEEAKLVENRRPDGHIVGVPIVERLVLT